MFIQKFIWVIGFLIIFWGLIKFFTYTILKLFPKTVNELAREKLKANIAKLEFKRIKLETKKVQVELTEDELNLEISISKINKKITELEEKLADLNN